MTRKKKNKTRYKPAAITFENLQFHNNNNNNNKINDSINNNKESFDDDRFSESSSSDSGKSEFDEEYQRNRPPPIPIDPSRVKPVQAQKPNIINDNITTNGTLKNNEGEIDTKTDKLSKSKRKRLRRQRKKRGNPAQSNDVISESLTNNIQMTTTTTVIEVSSKQECNDENFIEHPNNVTNNEGEITTNANCKKKRRRNRGGRKKSSNSIQQPSVLEQTDENIEKSSRISRNAKRNSKNDNRQILLNKHSHTYAEIVAQKMVKEMAKVIGELLIPIFEMRYTVRSSYRMFLAAVEVIKASNWEVEYERIPLLVDTTDSIHYEVAKTDKKHRKRKQKKKKVVVTQADSKSEPIRTHLSYAEMVKTKVNTRTTCEQ